MPPVSRPTPDQLLRRVQAEEKETRTGRLKVFLGYASGVGKSFRMLDEGRRRRERGQDVVVGAVQPQISSQLEELLARLEIIPLKFIDGIPVMNVEAILRRRPYVCLVDGLAYDNPAGSRNAHRWQDVEQLLSAGISVITTINLQYVEECREQVERIRGKRVNVSVPEAFLRKADEIVVVDAPAEICLTQNDGSSNESGADDQQKKLSHLREIALLLAADVVDDQLDAYLKQTGAHQSLGTHDRILVCLTPKINATRMIERARRARDKFHGELFAVYVSCGQLGEKDQAALEHNLALARSAGAEITLLDSDDPVTPIIDFARAHGITQMFIGHSDSGGWRARFTRTTVDRLIHEADGIDVKLLPQ
jgi:two-component system sensor histidine kinase KdpD